MRQSPSAERLMQGANARERPKARNLLFRHADRLAAAAKLGSRRDAARKLEIKHCPREALRDGLPGVGLSSLFTRFDSRGDALRYGGLTNLRGFRPVRHTPHGPDALPLRIAPRHIVSRTSKPRTNACPMSKRTNLICRVNPITRNKFSEFFIRD